MIWTEETINSYRRLVKTIGRFSKYQIYSDIGLHKKFDDVGVFKALRINQNNNQTGFYAFKVSSEWLLRACSVLRRSDTDADSPNYQRVLEQARVNKISEFLNREYWALPNAIILCTNNILDKLSVRFRGGKISLPSIIGGYWIMDGQHRLYGFAKNQQRTSHGKDELLCTIFVSKEMGKFGLEQQANTFIDINSNAKKVKTSLLLELLQRYQLLGIREYPALSLVTALSKSSTFKNLISGYSRKGGTISLTTFVTNQAMNRLLSATGPFSSRNRSREAIKKRATQHLKIYFNLVAKEFNNIWGNKDYGLSSDRGIRGLLRLYLKIYEYYGRLPTREQILHILKILHGSNFDFSISNLAQFNGEQGAKALLIEWERQIAISLSGFSSESPAKNIELPDEESEQVEFKETLRWNIHTSLSDPEIFEEVLITVDAFLNSRGGRIFVGITDEGVPVGIDKDLQTLNKNKHRAKDLLKQFLANQFRDRFDPAIVGRYEILIQENNGNEILIIDVKKSDRAIYVKISGRQEFYCREVNRSRKLEAGELISYIEERFPN